MDCESPQIALLKDLIVSAQTGNDGAVTLLRSICVSAAKQAPLPDLLALGQCLVHLGTQATRDEASRN